jgi:hypothetical protein
MAQLEGPERTRGAQQQAEQVVARALEARHVRGVSVRAAGIEVDLAR